MTLFDCIAPCKLGLESLVTEELRALGMEGIKTLNGEVHFSTDPAGLARANLWLRMAERVLVRLSNFPATTFDELFEGVSEIGWEEFLPKDAHIRILAKCIKSQLMSERTCQSIAQKAIVEVMTRAHRQAWMPETGIEFKIHLIIQNDDVTVALDSSGAGLHKRGYRAQAGEAPLRETLAAALVTLSGWNPSRALFDPFCGSGTIPIEAAMIGANIAPGLNRFFDAEQWPFIPSSVWKKARQEAESKILHNSFLIHASDIDGQVLQVARDNAIQAGIQEFIQFEEKSFETFRPAGERPIVICNPPYGERLDDVEEAEAIYRTMASVFPPHKAQYFILTPHLDFQKLFARKAAKNRKLYNGKIKCYLYEYL
ncbi:MAG: class I SAM-dependent RNA methyltransferase [Candidatus Peregrinibacteria bacterium]